nr:putative metallopeptidase [Sinorhizobium meliloti]
MDRGNLPRSVVSAPQRGACAPGPRRDLHIRGHDVEELLGVVCRYGADAADVRAIVDAANQPPVIARGQIAMLAAPAS